MRNLPVDREPVAKRTLPAVRFRVTAYMAAIRPFRHLIVYPAMMREIGRAWRAGD
jgi:hypothetical protein